MDSMCGKLARWLRILGCDTLYVDPTKDDSDILEIVKERILVTSDRALARRAANSGIRVLLVPEDLGEALSIVSGAAGVRLRIDPRDTRCPFCNSPLVVVSREGLPDGVPREVIRSHTRFLLCPGCGKVFWFGTHYWNMLRFLAGVKKIRRPGPLTGGPVMRGDGNDL